MLDIGTIQRQQYIPFSLSGSAEYTSPGTYSFVVPANIYLMSGVFVGPGGNGPGGDLRWINNFPVTPGETLTVIVGAYGAYSTSTSTSLARSTNTIVIASNIKITTSSAVGAGPLGGSIGGGDGGTFNNGESITVSKTSSLFSLYTASYAMISVLLSLLDKGFVDTNSIIIESSIT